MSKLKPIISNKDKNLITFKSFVKNITVSDMKVFKTNFQDLLIIKSKSFKDNRGILG